MIQHVNNIRIEPVTPRISNKFESLINLHRPAGRRSIEPQLVPAIQKLWDHLNDPPSWTVSGITTAIGTTDFARYVFQKSFHGKRSAIYNPDGTKEQHVSDLEERDQIRYLPTLVGPTWIDAFEYREAQYSRRYAIRARWAHLVTASYIYWKRDHTFSTGYLTHTRYCQMDDPAEYFSEHSPLHCLWLVLYITRYDRLQPFALIFLSALGPIFIRKLLHTLVHDSSTIICIVLSVSAYSRILTIP